VLSELAHGAQKTFDNADALYREAQLLGAAGALGRALLLHQISLEECAKIETLGAWATSLMAGYSVDEKKVLAGFTSHAQKNRTNAYMLQGSAEEKAAKERGDWKTAGEEFKNLQAEFHEKSNVANSIGLMPWAICRRIGQGRTDRCAAGGNCGPESEGPAHIPVLQSLRLLPADTYRGKQA
jgi:AbiV family abortive infection protein